MIQRPAIKLTKAARERGHPTVDRKQVRWDRLGLLVGADENWQLTHHPQALAHTAIQ